MALLNTLSHVLEMAHVSFSRWVLQGSHPHGSLQAWQEEVLNILVSKAQNNLPGDPEALPSPSDLPLC